MGTQLGVINGKYLKRFWGGNERGVCLQITSDSGYNQFTASELIAALPLIKSIIDYELGRKQSEIIEAINMNKELLNTIVKDMRDVNQMAINQPIFDVAALMSLGKVEITGIGDE